MKKKRTVRTLACLVVGLLVLTGSAYANYDNANGYTMYKDALKKMLYVENVSVTGKISLEQNGKSIDSSAMDFQYDRNGNPSEHSRYTYSTGNYNENWIQDGKIIASDNGKNYQSYEASNKGFNDDFLSAEKEDKKMAEKMINFTELIADTFVGDLKNNFVLVSKEDGKQTYQIDLSGQQIPAYVNAGLGVMFSSYAYHDDYVPTYVAFGDGFDYDTMDGDKQQEYMQKAHDEIENHGGQGIALINGDGSITYFATEEEYRNEIGVDEAFGTDVFALMGTDPVIDSVSCYVTFDEEGRILENRIEGTMTGQGSDGQKNTLTLKMNLQLFDYGTTKLERPDLSGVNVKEI